MATKQTQSMEEDVAGRGGGANTPTLLLGFLLLFWFLHLCPNPEADGRSELRQSCFTVETAFW